MNYLGKFVSNVRGLYQEINPATLTGALDVIVVRQEDGSYLGSPFHVRFGKLSVLRCKEKKVEIFLNDLPTNLEMMLGQAGEAFFLVPDLEEVPAASGPGETAIPPQDSQHASMPPLRGSQSATELSSLSDVDDPLARAVESIMVRPDMEVHSDPSCPRRELEGPSAKSPPKPVPIVVSNCSQNPELDRSGSYTGGLYLSKSMDAGHFSDPDRPNSPTVFSHTVLSDSEADRINVKEPVQDEMTWTWGKLPRFDTPQRISTRASSSKDSPKMHRKKSNKVLTDGGLYLDDVLNAERDVAEMYLNPRLETELYHREATTSESMEILSLPETIEMSLCGNLKDMKVKPDNFDKHLVSYEKFCSSPTSVLSNYSLVVRIDDSFYSWAVAGPMITCYAFFGQPLTKEAMKDLKAKYMPKKRRSWFSWRQAEEKDSSDDESTGKKPSSATVLTSEGNLGGVKEGSRPPSPTSGDMADDDRVFYGGMRYRKVLKLYSEQLASLNLMPGANDITYSVTTKYQGTVSCSAKIYLWDHSDHIVISDIDGTITRSDVFGHILPLVGKDWSQNGVADLFTKIKSNGYQILYLSSRSIGLAKVTREYLENIRQEGNSLPDGPILLSPSSLLKAFRRELIDRRPQDFKIECLQDIAKLFPAESNPFYAGYGNRPTDTLAYQAVKIPPSRIFIINYEGNIKLELASSFSSTYASLAEYYDSLFPPLRAVDNLAVPRQVEFGDFVFWKPHLPVVDQFVPQYPLQ